VNARADKGITPLHVAAMNGHPETLALLLDAGARVNAMTRSDGDFLDVSVMGTGGAGSKFKASIFCPGPPCPLTLPYARTPA